MGNKRAWAAGWGRAEPGKGIDGTMRKFITFGPAVVVLLTTLVTLVAAPQAVRMIGYANTEATIHLAQQTLAQDDILHRIDRATRAVADLVEPSVVHIGVEQVGSGGRGRGMGAMGGRRWIRASQGSGWIYDAEGHIVTNAHVVRDASEIVVQLQDGRQVPAEVTGIDPKTDIAVLKVPVKEGLFPIMLATGYEPHQGDTVFAFGSPFGFKFSMSQGIVSGLGRDPMAVIGEDGYTNFIQTDAAVNPGNSGGPLVNAEGKLIGMNVAIANARGSDGDSEGQSAGISFAIPLSTIDPVVSQIISGGVAVKGFLGIVHTNDDQLNLAALNDAGYHGRGIAVTDVAPGGPAEKAGIAAGDIITSINGQAVANIPALRALIANRGPGESLDLTLWRKGEELKKSVLLDVLPPSRAELQETAEQLAEYGVTRFGESENGELVVAEVVTRSAAYSAGIRPGQVITGVAGTQVRQMVELLVELYKKGFVRGQPVDLTVVDPDSGEKTIPLTR